MTVGREKGGGGGGGGGAGPVHIGNHWPVSLRVSKAMTKKADREAAIVSFAALQVQSGAVVTHRARNSTQRTHSRGPPLSTNR